MIVITGAAGFIGSVVAGYFNKQGYKDLVLVDDFSREDKKPNFESKKYHLLVPREELFRWITGKEQLIQAIIHLGARTDTMEPNEKIFEKLNLEYSKKIWNIASFHQIPLIYASSAATYGDGSHGFDDDESQLEKLRPMNPYAISKHKFDLWVKEQSLKGKQPFFWAGLKFFNVYGPNEYHKGRMASVVFHGFNQIKNTGKIRLFKSYKPEYKHGEQKRDFVYVKDVAKVIYHLFQNKPKSGIYNLGSGRARTFNDLAKAIFKALNLPENIEYIEMPEYIKDKYQYFTEAKMEKLKTQGQFNEEFTPLEEGVKDYVNNFLEKKRYF